VATAWLLVAGDWLLVTGGPVADHLCCRQAVALDKAGLMRTADL